MESSTLSSKKYIKYFERYVQKKKPNKSLNFRKTFKHKRNQIFHPSYIPYEKHFQLNKADIKDAFFKVICRNEDTQSLFDGINEFHEICKYNEEILKEKRIKHENYQKVKQKLKNEKIAFYNEKNVKKIIEVIIKEENLLPPSFNKVEMVMVTPPSIQTLNKEQKGGKQKLCSFLKYFTSYKNGKVIICKTKLINFVHQNQLISKLPPNFEDLDTLPLCIHISKCLRRSKCCRF